MFMSFNPIKKAIIIIFVNVVMYTVEDRGYICLNS